MLKLGLKGWQMARMTKEERAAKWDAEFIPCKNHPERRCNRSRYVTRRMARCAVCIYLFPTQERYRLSEKGRANTNRARTRWLATPNNKEKHKAWDNIYQESDRGKILRAFREDRSLHG